jgi:hypothetical protein
MNARLVWCGAGAAHGRLRMQIQACVRRVLVVIQETGTPLSVPRPQRGVCRDWHGW